jgi:hypothetical protein
MVRCRKTKRQSFNPEWFRDRLRRPEQQVLPKNANLNHGGFLARRLDVRVRLTRKLSEAINGLDLRPFRVGQVIDLADPLGRMLIAERWGEEVVPLDQPTTADDYQQPPAQGTRKHRRTATSRPEHPRSERPAPRQKKT